MEQESRKKAQDTVHEVIHEHETFSDMAAFTTKSGVVGKLLVISLIVVSLAVTAFVGFAIFRGVNGENYIGNDQYQAVFLADGQTYYGKIADLDSTTLTLSDVYYLKVDQKVQSQQLEPKNEKEADDVITLVKLGEEKHCPADEMYINRDQVLFWENIRPEGQVVKAIETYLAQNENNDDVVCSQIAN